MPARQELAHALAEDRRAPQTAADEDRKQKAAKAAQVRLLLEDGTLYPEPGTLRFADLAVDPGTGSVLLRAEFPNPRRELLPGTFARVRFPQAEVEAAIRIPQRSVTVSPLGQAVMVVDAEGKVNSRTVKTGGMADQDFLIESGLKPGDQVIVNGLQKARPGAMVKPVPWDPAKKPGPPPGAVPPAPTAEAKPADAKK